MPDVFPHSPERPRCRARLARRAGASGCTGFRRVVCCCRSAAESEGGPVPAFSQCNEEMATKIDAGWSQSWNPGRRERMRFVHCEFKGGTAALHRPAGRSHARGLRACLAAGFGVARRRRFRLVRYTPRFVSPGLDRHSTARATTGASPAGGCASPIVRRRPRPEAHRGRTPRLRAGDAATVILRMAETPDEEPLAIPLAAVVTARLEIEL